MENGISQEKLLEKLTKMPNIETKISMSKDKKWVIIKTIMTEILSKKYFDAIFKDEKKAEEEPEND